MQMQCSLGIFSNTIEKGGQQLWWWQGAQLLEIPNCHKHIDNHIGQVWISALTTRMLAHSPLIPRAHQIYKYFILLFLKQQD